MAKWLKVGNNRWNIDQVGAFGAISNGIGGFEVVAVGPGVAVTTGNAVLSVGGTYTSQADAVAALDTLLANLSDTDGGS